MTSEQEEPKKEMFTRKYRCPECHKKELVKRVYTEERCDNCEHINHFPHKSREKKQ